MQWKRRWPRSRGRCGAGWELVGWQSGRKDSGDGAGARGPAPKPPRRPDPRPPAAWAPPLCPQLAKSQSAAAALEAREAVAEEKEEKELVRRAAALIDPKRIMLRDKLAFVVGA